VQELKSAHQSMFQAKGEVCRPNCTETKSRSFEMKKNGIMGGNWDTEKQGKRSGGRNKEDTKNQSAPAHVKKGGGDFPELVGQKDAREKDRMQARG